MYVCSSTTCVRLSVFFQYTVVAGRILLHACSTVYCSLYLSFRPFFFRQNHLATLLLHACVRGSSSSTTCVTDQLRSPRSWSLSVCLCVCMYVVVLHVSVCLSVFSGWPYTAACMKYIFRPPLGVCFSSSLSVCLSACFRCTAACSQYVCFVRHGSAKKSS